MREWVARRRLVVLIALGLVVAGGVGGGGYFAFRTYEYIEHDNDFCLSCHLMQEPFELFARSEHRGLGCKACHKPSFIGRSQMALTQLIEQPDTLSAHAEVPNEKCASCHVDGDPEQWEIVSATAGHRVHLESEEPELAELECVECHSSTLHSFAPRDETCTQSGCHTDADIHLGSMSDRAIDCVACHSFNTHVADTASMETALAALQPTDMECLSCHAMRSLVDMPEDEPHDAVCSTCHKPHEQDTPAEAVETCATVGCHDDILGATAFHRGLAHAVAEDCSSCHVAHEFRVTGDDCLACHTEVFEDGSAGARGPVGGGPPMVPNPELAVSLLWLEPSPQAYRHGPAAAATEAVFAALLPPQEVQSGPSDAVFRHGEHREVECSSCHAEGDTHGELAVITIEDCRGCHHEPPEVDSCDGCHETGAPELQSLAVVAPMSFTVGEPVEREVPFSHTEHADTTCDTCHEQNLEQSWRVTSCDGCHVEHHESTEVRCASCHVQAPEEEHPLEQVHVGCLGSGCHTSLPLEDAPRARNTCVVCHQEEEDHKPEEECVACHLLPDARVGAGWEPAKSEEPR